MFKKINKYLFENKEISALMFLYFLILNFWYKKISNDSVFEQLIKFENDDFYFIPYLTSLIFKFLKNYLSIEVIGYFSIVIIPILMQLCKKKGTFESGNLVDKTKLFLFTNSIIQTKPAWKKKFL